MTIQRESATANRRLGAAWLTLCLALGVHVADEALTDFLSVYNPTVRAIREAVPWLPLPIFSFEVWISGLIAAVIALLALSPLAFRDSARLRPLAYALGVLMTLNALAHAVGSILLSRPMPGVYSSPLLLAAALFLLVALRRGETAGLGR